MTTGCSLLANQLITRGTLALHIDLRSKHLPRKMKQLCIRVSKGYNVGPRGSYSHDQLDSLDLQAFAHLLFPMNFGLFFLHSSDTLLVFETKPLQKEQRPLADQPVLPDLHLQHFSVVADPHLPDIVTTSSSPTAASASSSTFSCKKMPADCSFESHS